MSCKKDKSSTSPILKFKSVSTTSLYNQQLISFTLSFTDVPGNLVDSVFVQEAVLNCPASNFEDFRAIPDYPTSKNQSGDIVVTYGYNVSGYSGVSSPQCQENDTAVFRFAVKDLNNNSSDTVTSPSIILYY